MLDIEKKFRLVFSLTYDDYNNLQNNLILRKKILRDFRFFVLGCLVSLSSKMMTRLSAMHSVRYLLCVITLCATSEDSMMTRL